MKVLFVNNTISEFHIGCYGVSKTIINDIYTRYTEGCEIVSIYTSQLKTRSLDSLKALVDQNSFEKVIVNGEGSLHTKNTEGKRIFELVDYILTKKDSPFLSIINASIYHLPDPWLETLRLVDCIEVRDLNSKYYLHSKNIKSIFKPDRLFKFLSDSHFEFSENNKRDDNSILVFDSVDKNHQNIIENIAKVDKTLLYGTVDLSPLWLIQNGNYKVSSLVDLKNIIRFYLKIIKRNIKYHDMMGTKLISKFDKNPLVNNDMLPLVMTSRYHIVVMCLFYSLDFSYIKSNTKKIQSLLECFSEEFPGSIEVIDDEHNCELKKVKLKYSTDDIYSYINSYSYGV